MNKLIASCIGVFLTVNGMTQSCLPQGMRFSRQTQVDSFAIMFPDCHKIEGDVDIAGENITNLNGLSGVRSIGGYLYFEYNSKLPRLTGLNNLTSIGKYLRIFDNNSLISLDGLENLDTIGDYLSIVRNNRLANLSGLNNLKKVNRISFSNNPALTDVSSFNKLTNIQHLFIESNPSLTNISGFKQLDSIFYLMINYNAKLDKISGFDTLTYVYSLSIGVNPALTTLDGFKFLNSAEDLLLVMNAELTNLSGLGNLRTVKDNLTLHLNNSLNSLVWLHNLEFVGKLNIGGCYSLKSLEGLENLNAETIENVTITNNDSLSDCAIKSLCEYLASSGGLVEIHDNKAGCNSKAEVDTACRHLSVENSTLNTGFQLYPNPSSQSVIIETENIFKDCILSISDLSGHEQIRISIIDRKTLVDIGKLPPGIFVIRIIQQSMVLNFKLVKSSK